MQFECTYNWENENEYSHGNSFTGTLEECLEYINSREEITFSIVIPEGIRVHKLKEGAKVVSLSAHGFKFSDGTESEAQDKDVVEFFTLSREYREMSPVKGMGVNAMKMVLTEEQLLVLAEVQRLVDVVILPFPVLTALREQGVRDKYPSCLAFNATKETQRSAPQDKVVDIDNWSY